MAWIILVLLIYPLFGALLVTRNLRGMQVSASLPEWVTLILLWPLMVRFFLQLALMQARISELESWADSKEKNP
jgi:hypothetical protein